jgi:glycerate kinase
MILVAPDSFKGTYTAAQVAAHIANGIRSAGGTAQEMPVADGGEGTFDVIFQGLQAQPLTVRTVGPWGDETNAVIGLSQNGTAIVELASASGLNMPTEQTRDPLAATTYGTGVLIAEAVRQGARQILVAAGGSATTDGGAGAITAIEEAGGLHGAQLVVLSDVTTRFSDAARVFGPQKGADPATIQLLTQRLKRLAETLKRDPRNVDRGGAAGGFAGGMWAQYEASLVSGADYILDLLKADAHIAASEAVIVGEGRLDSQTGQGKIISGILARSRGVPVYAVVGSVHEDLGNYTNNFADIITASDGPAMTAAGAQIAARKR